MRDDCTIDEFAHMLGVTSTTVRSWIKRGKLPEAFKNEKDCWRIPSDTDRPTKIYLYDKKPKPLSRLAQKDKDIQDLRLELADLNKRHIAHVEKYAALLGRYDKLLLEWEIAKEDATVFEGKYNDMKSQYDQLALKIKGLDLHNEGVCHLQEIVQKPVRKVGRPRKYR